MSAKLPPTFLANLFDPVTRCLTPKAARALVNLRLDATAQARLDLLADKCNEGTLTSLERAEYERYVHAIDLIGILQSKARVQLSRRKAS